MTVEAELPDGTVLEFPAGTSPDVVQRAVRKRLGVAQPAPAEPEKRPLSQTLKQAAGDLAAGALRGAGSIGATILAPIDAAARAVGIQNDFIGRTDRRQAMDEGLREMGANPDSLLYQGGKLGTEIAGTLPVGGLLAKGAQTAGAAPVLVNALRSAGMSAGGQTGAKTLAARVAGGAATGGASAALINPEDAAMGAMVGGGLPVAGAVAKGATRLGRAVAGASTGVGDDALRVAYESGKAGGAQAQALRENMRGQADMLGVLDDARANLDAIRSAKNTAYRQNMAAVKADKAVLDMAPIEQSIQDAVNKFTFKGQPRNPEVLAALDEAAQTVQKWRQLNPAEFHTPEGLDALKQQIRALRNKVPVDARDVRSALGDVYNSTKKQIEAQAPEYSKAMKDYSQASELIDEITRTLSLGEKKTADTAMRKLQSIMRNNVNTNYGTRTQLLQELEQQGGRQLAPQLAGQALNDWTPRGIQRATAIPTAIAAGSTAGIPAAIGATAMSSPRLMGEAAYLSGAASRNLDPVIQALRRAGYYGAPVAAAD